MVMPSAVSTSSWIRLANAASKRTTTVIMVQQQPQQPPQLRTFATNRSNSPPPRPNKNKNHNNDTSFFANLRWKAAEVLTSSLEGSQKEQLLETLNAVPKQQLQEHDDHEEELIAKSIGEAVAAARAQEAQESQSKWEREKDNIRKQAEEAAMARVENELRIQERRLALEKWEQELQQEQNNNSQVVGNEDATTTEEAEIVNGSDTTTTTITTTTPADTMVQEEEAYTAANPHHHPVLGPALVDLGHKRIHIVSASALAAIPIWKKQRIYRHERAKVMATDKLKTVGLGLPGIIALHENEKGELSILDGQHRVGMMTILEELLLERKDPDGSSVNNNNNSSFDLNRILVEVFPPSATETTTFTAQDIFTEINKAEPVKLVDMPGVASQKHRKLITDTAAKLKTAFPDMFKPSQNCRAPHVNIDNLRDALFASDVLKRHSIKSQKALMSWMMDQNEWLRVKFEQEPPANASKTAYAKAVKFNFFLGLESSWLYK